MQQKQVLALYCAILAPFVGLGIYLYLHNTQSITLVPKVANYTVDTAAFSSLKAIPDLKRDVLVRSTYTDTDSAKLVAKINTVRVRLQKNPQNADDWFTLGLLYHDAGDYEKVREVWEFLLSVIVGPQSAVVLDNLGKLYLFDLQDYPKAEEYFRKSIVANPTLTTPYFELFELYSLSYKKETSAAADILKQAEAKFPDDLGIPITLATYYRDRGEKAMAKVHFLKALDIARTAQRIDMVSQINADLVKLP